MDPHARRPAPTVSNLVPVWDAPVMADDGGGRFEPAAAAPAVEHAVERTLRVEQHAPAAARPAAPAPPAVPVQVPATRPEPAGEARQRARPIVAPEQFDAAEPPARRTAYELLDADESTWAEAEDALPRVDYDALRRRDIARELLRARLVAIAERRERRSAYEIAFIMLAAAVSVLLAAPPLVQVLLAAHGQA